jgi:hypothetical protein
MTVRSAATRNSGGVSEPTATVWPNDVARDYGSINRRNNFGIAEVDLGGVKGCFELSYRCLVALDLRLRLLIRLARVVKRFPGNGPTLRPDLGALEGFLRRGEIFFVPFDSGPACQQISLVLIDYELIGIDCRRRRSAGCSCARSHGGARSASLPEARTDCQSVRVSGLRDLFRL